MKDSRYNREPIKSKGSGGTKIFWGLMALAFVFFFNPNIGVIDILPDFIGYLLLSLALLKVSMLCEGLADARRAFEKMILVDVAKFLSMIWVFGVNSSNDRTSSLMLWSFVFAVLEMIFAIPAFIKLFDGLSELGNFHDNTSIHGSKRAGGTSYTDKLKVFTVIFVGFKAAMTLLPELTALSTAAYEDSSSVLNLYRYIGVIRALCMIPVCIFGIVWLASAIRYFLRLAADKTLHASVGKAYNEKVAPKHGLFTIRNVRVATWFFVAAAVFTIDVKLEEVNILPDIVSVLLMAVAFAYFAKTAKLSKKMPVLLMALFGVSTVFTVLSEAYFLEHYTYNAIEKSSEALVTYLVYVGAVALQGILFVCLLSAFFKELRHVITEHTGYVLGREINSDGERKRIEEVHGEIHRSFTKIVDIAIVYVLSDVLYSLYGAFYAFMNKNFAFLSIVNIAAGILFVCVTVRAVDELREAVQTKYMLE